MGERIGDAVDEAVVREEREGLVMGRSRDGMKSNEVLPMAVAMVRVEVMAKPLRANVFCDWEDMVGNVTAAKGVKVRVYTGRKEREKLYLSALMIGGDVKVESRQADDVRSSHEAEDGEIEA